MCPCSLSNNIFYSMNPIKIVVLAFVLVLSCDCQFSSFVDGYLFDVPVEFISVLDAELPLDQYISYIIPGQQDLKRIGERSTESCQYPFVSINGKCSCPSNKKFVFGTCIDVNDVKQISLDSAEESNQDSQDSIASDTQDQNNQQSQDPNQSQNKEEENNSETNNLQEQDPVNNAAADFVQDDDQQNVNDNDDEDQKKRVEKKNLSTTSTAKVTKIQCPLLKIDQITTTDSIQNLALISRTYNGAQNNQQNPSWGSAGSLLQRRVRANYIDGIRQPINNLPGPRIVSNTIGKQTNPIQKSRVNATIAFTIYGQFIDHDIDLTFSQRASTGSAEFMHIQIPEGDQFFKNQSQINFSRSQFVQNTGEARRHKNFITSWIDGSQIYGSDNQTNCALRTFKQGKLKTSGSPDEQFLPLFNGFFRAGDVRAIENLILTSYQTAFLREHNSICDRVLKKNPNFNDETLFQIARNYVIGLLQKIAMKDFLPILLGDKYSKVIGDYSGYNPNLNPNIPTQFSTASYRIGHSILVNKIPGIDQNGRVVKQFDLHDLFFSMGVWNADFYNNILRGSAKTLTKQKSNELVDAVRNLLVLDPNKRAVKLDLFALNIQRGRDHGLPTYNNARAAFGLPKITTFEQILPQKHLNAASKLKSVYGTPDNLELFLGIICQKPVDNGIVGQLGAEIIGQTFRNLRDADKFWYESAYPKSIVTQIDKTELGDVCRRNSKATDLPSNMFRISG